jgi:hypothetical protein
MFRIMFGVNECCLLVHNIRWTYGSATLKQMTWGGGGNGTLKEVTVGGVCGELKEVAVGGMD